MENVKINKIMKSYGFENKGICWEEVDVMENEKSFIPVDLINELMEIKG